MRKRKVGALAGFALSGLMMTTTVMTAATPKVTGSTTLKDFQPAGTTDKKHKKQQYDFSFIASGQQYTCRSSEKKKLKATDFVVGSSLSYELQGTKGKVTGGNGKEVPCTVVRVANASAAQQ